MGFYQTIDNTIDYGGQSAVSSGFNQDVVCCLVLIPESITMTCVLVQEDPNRIAQQLPFLLGFLSLTRNEILCFFNEIGGSLEVCTHFALSMIAHTCYSFFWNDGSQGEGCGIWLMASCRISKSAEFRLDLLIIAELMYHIYWASKVCNADAQLNVGLSSIQT